MEQLANLKPYLESFIGTTTHKSSELYDWVKKNDLFSNIVGIVIGALFVFGLLSINLIFSLLTFGLSLYSIREIIKYKTSNTVDTNSTFMTLCFWVSLSTMSQFYNFMYVLLNAFGGFILVALLNFGYMYIFTNIINNLQQWYTVAVGGLDKLDMKRAVEQTQTNYNKTPENIAGNINLLTKLYSINSVIFDDVILKYGSKLTSGTFGIIKSGSSFTTGLFSNAFNKLYSTMSQTKTEQPVIDKTTLGTQAEQITVETLAEPTHTPTEVTHTQTLAEQKEETENILDEQVPN